jgi:hypothetical protein
MKIAIISLLLSSVFLVGGCSRTQRISALADRWGIGQHKTCTFLVPANVVCDMADVPATHWDADNMRIATSRSNVVERGDYNASFSTGTPDYSVWDCHKTGGDNVGINCSTIHKLSDDESQKLRTWDAVEKQSMETLAELKGERDSPKENSAHCDVSSSDFFQCMHSVMDSRKAERDTVDRKSQEVVDAAKIEAAKVGRDFDPR